MKYKLSLSAIALSFFLSACDQQEDANKELSKTSSSIPQAIALGEVDGLQERLLKLEAQLSVLESEFSSYESKVNTRLEPLEVNTAENTSDIISLHDLLRSETQSIRSQIQSLSNQLQTLRDQMPNQIMAGLPENINELRGENIPINVCVDFPCSRSNGIVYMNDGSSTLTIHLEISASFSGTGGIPPAVLPPYAYLSAILRKADGSSRELRPIRLALGEEVFERSVSIHLPPGASLKLGGYTSGILSMSIIEAYEQSLDLN